MIRLLRAADRVATPWKNGGGTTREVAVWPPGARLDTFDWRVSIAEVHDAGPFSLFPDIDRTIMIVRGRLVLTFDGCDVELRPDSAPFAFPGDVACAGRPMNGPVMDLNVMTRRGKHVATIERISAGPSAVATACTLVVARVPTGLRGHDHMLTLSAFDAVLLDRDSERGVSLSGDAWAIGFD